MVYAYMRMANTKNTKRSYKKNNRLYESLKEQAAANHSKREITEETRKKISAALTGRPSHQKGWKRSEEARMRISEGVLASGQVAWNKGVPRSEETKEKQRQSMKGRIPWNKGKKRPTC
jgi:hypothetical protein